MQSTLVYSHIFPLAILRSTPNHTPFKHMCPHFRDVWWTLVYHTPSISDPSSSMDIRKNKKMKHVKCWSHDNEIWRIKPWPRTIKVFVKSCSLRNFSMMQSYFQDIPWMNDEIHEIKSHKTYELLSSKQINVLWLKWWTNLILMFF